jgi:hypothetical protein
MSDEVEMSFNVFMITHIFMFLLGALAGCMVIKDSCRKEAISHGYASYEIVDAKTGRTEFKWKEQSK